MKSICKYGLLTAAYAVITTGTVTAASMDVYRVAPVLFATNILWLTILFTAGVVLNVKLLIPKLLKQEKYLYYYGSIFLTTCAIISLGYFGEIFIRQMLALPQRIAIPCSPWIILGSAGNCMVIILMFVAMGMISLYNAWRKEAELEDNLNLKLKSYTHEIRHRLNAEFILESLKAIREAIEERSRNVNKLIIDLSAYLRKHLYDLPAPPQEINEEQPLNTSLLRDFIINKKFKVWRHLVFQAVLILVSLDVFFETPDKPNFNLDNLIGALAELAAFELLTYINVLWLYKMFRKSRNLTAYVRNILIMVALFILPLITIQILTYSENVFRKSVPIELTILTTAGTLLTLTMFIGGCTAMLLIQDRVAEKYRLTKLKAEIIRLEYTFLKKQINPHFLFNVLNNLGIQSIAEPGEALKMAMELERLIKYQFTETDNTETTLGNEIKFIQSYLALEKTRVDILEFEIHSPQYAGDVQVPTLLFLPFVENAVKHSVVIAEKRIIKIKFVVKDERLIFECKNSYRVNPELHKNKKGGLGLSNTTRRLDLLYGTEYKYATTICQDLYDVVLDIPLDFHSL